MRFSAFDSFFALGRAAVVAAAVAAASCGGATDPDPCDPGLTLCNDVCVDLDDDAAHCGACDVACAAGESCRAGACAAGCPAGLTDCGGACVDTGSDAANCGACGAPCTGGSRSCQAGACVSACSPGLTECSGTCVDTQTDSLNCGGCGGVCTAGFACQGGTCSLACPPGLEACGGICADLQNDSANCGACFASCGFEAFCSFGTCAPFCGGGQTACPEGCVDLNSDLRNCGGCGVACGPGERCQASLCTLSAPDCPFADLGSIVPQTVTGSTLGRPNDVEPSCGSGGSSDTGFTFTAPASGAYTFDTVGSAYDTVLDVRDGACDGQELACNDDTVMVQSEVIVDLAAGQSVVVVVDGFAGQSGDYVLNVTSTFACAPGQTLCDGGACVDLQTDSANCGACGLFCDLGAPCQAGSCVPICPMGQALCGGACADLSSDPANCGTCGALCGAGATCVAGVCAGPAGGCPFADLGSTTPQTVTGSTVGRPDDLHPMCGSSRASDAGYTFTAPVTRSYTFTTSGSRYDTVLAVLDGGCAGPELACNDDDRGLQSAVSVTLTAGQTVVIVVDGFATHSGDYTLNLN